MYIHLKFTTLKCDSILNSYCSQCFEDPANDKFFDQLVTYQVLLDLLYSHEMYDEMYRVFEKVKERQVNMSKYPKYPVVLILAACYKQVGGA